MTINLRSNDSRIYPKVYRYHFSDTSDWDRIIRDIRELRRIMSYSNDGSIIREVIPGINVSSDQDIIQYIINNFINENSLTFQLDLAKHETSTLSMGPNQDDPVNLQCSVNGVNNLRVIDASIWPTVRVSGTMALTYMIGEKCSQHILDRYDSQTSQSKWQFQHYIILFSCLFGFIVIAALLYYCYFVKRRRQRPYHVVTRNTPLVDIKNRM
eukprot:294473_1